MDVYRIMHRIEKKKKNDVKTRVKKNTRAILGIQEARTTYKLNKVPHQK